MVSDVGWILPRYCAVCGERAFGDLLQGHCVLCAMRWPDVRGDSGSALVRARMQVPWASAGFRVPDGPSLRHRLYGLKYGGERRWGLEAGRWVAAGNPWPFGEDVVLVPVPLHWRRRWRRGYNQAEWICRGMAEVWGAALARGVLRRRQHATSLTATGRAGRQHALRATYEASAERITERRFVLVDDVMTSGSTFRAAASVLEAAGGQWQGVAVWGLA
jgi:predicted amidophosphoribosyltransferase